MTTNSAPRFRPLKSSFRRRGRSIIFLPHLLENARICNNVDYIVLSGWESTTIDDHSGMVDALRQLKADPALIHQASQPELLVIRPRHYVIARGDATVIDVHQINEQNMTGSWPCCDRLNSRS